MSSREDRDEPGAARERDVAGANGTSATGGGRMTDWRSNRGVGILLLFLVAGIGIYIWQSDWAHRVLRDGFTLGGFPLIGVGLMAICILILIFDNRARMVEPELASLTAFGVLVGVGALVVLFLTFQAFWMIGFTPSVALFVAVTAAALGYRPIWIPVVTGIGAAAFLRGVAYLLGVQLPDGPLLALVGF